MIRKSKIALLLGFTLFVVTFGLYWQTRNFEFINYDDREYIHNNGVVTNGLCIDSIKWAFGPEQCRQMSNWHPVTTLSWMLDVSLFGVNAGAMHLHNAVIHAVNGVLLFYFLLLLLGCMEQRGRQAENEKCEVESEKSFLTFNFSLLTYLAAFIGAAFWAWHPLRAESVAWVSSRKDVLSILFLLPGLMAYLKALKGGGKVWLFVSGVCYLLAYFSKPTAVVYPLLAVMLEYIVTRRISWRQNEFLVYLMGVLMVVTFIVQDVGGATGMLLPLMIRLENAVAGVGHYIAATLWPINLSIFYLYEIPVPLNRFITGAFFLLGVFAFLLNKVWPVIQAQWKNRAGPAEQSNGVVPSLMIAFGILWFGVCIGPVSGLIQVGFAACADRYTYLAGMGFSILLATALVLVQTWILERQARNIQVPLLAGLVSVCVGVLILNLCFAQAYLKKWNNTEQIFRQAIQAMKENYVAYCNVGYCHLNEGRYEQAFEYFLPSVKYVFAEFERKSVRTPYKDKIAINLGVAFSALEGAGMEKMALGIKLKEDLVLQTKVKMDDPLAEKKFFAQGLYAYWRELDNSAVQYFDEAIKLAPFDDYLWRFKGYSLERMGLKQEALVAFKRSFSLKPAKDIQQRIKALEQAIAAGN